MSGDWAYPPRATKRYSTGEPDVRVRQAAKGRFDVMRRYRTEPQAEGGALIHIEIIAYRGLPLDEACRRTEAMNQWLRDPRGEPPDWPDQELRK